MTTQARIAAAIVGLILAIAGFVIAYRAFFLDPGHGVYVTNSGATGQVPALWRVAGGLLVCVTGLGAAYYAARASRRPTRH